MMDIFAASDPSLASHSPKLSLTARTPDPKSVYYSSTGSAIDVSIYQPYVRSWYGNIKRADFHFGTGDKSGRIDIAMLPDQGTKGTLHVSVTWTKGTCSTGEQYVTS